MEPARLSIGRAAAQVSVTRRTIYYWMAAGMPFLSRGFGRRFVALADVQEWARLFSSRAHRRGITYRPRATSQGNTP